MTARAPSANIAGKVRPTAPAELQLGPRALAASAKSLSPTQQSRCHEPDQEAILNRLRQVKGPDLESNIVDLGLVSEVLVKDGRVSFSITVPAQRAAELEGLRRAADKVVREMEGVAGVLAVLTAERSGGARQRAARRPPPAPRCPRAPGCSRPAPRGGGPLPGPRRTASGRRGAAGGRPRTLQIPASST